MYMELRHLMVLYKKMLQVIVYCDLKKPPVAPTRTPQGTESFDGAPRIELVLAMTNVMELPECPPPYIFRVRLVDEAATAFEAEGTSVQLGDVVLVS